MILALRPSLPLDVEEVKENLPLLSQRVRKAELTNMYYQRGGTSRTRRHVSHGVRSRSLFMPRGQTKGTHSRWWMSHIITNNVYQVSIIMNDILHLNNRESLFQTQICFYIFHPPTIGTPTQVYIRLA